MILNFYSDLAKAKGAENIVRETFSQLASGYTFEDCSNDKECYYRGDIRAIAPDGREIYIEVKDDSRIHETHNVLCEYEVYYKESDYYGKGNMKSNYDIYCVVSQQERKIQSYGLQKVTLLSVHVNLEEMQNFRQLYL